MLLEYFKQYIKITRGVKSRTIQHYITGINTINSLLVKYNYPISDVFDCKSIEDLDGILFFLNNNEEFQNKNTIGHNMYSVAFMHFYHFASEDKSFFSQGIERMDMVITPPLQSTTVITSWNRNKILISQAIEGAHHLCEHNQSHETFISKSTGKSYMEGHHLIPLKYQPKFSCNIDVYANIVCLCPVCHRLLHYGTDRDRTYTAEKLFDSRQNRLINSGIDLSKQDFIDLII